MIFKQIVKILSSKGFWDYFLNFEWIVNTAKITEQEKKGEIKEVKDIKKELTLSEMHYMLKTAVKNKADDNLIQEYSQELADRIGLDIEEIYISIRYTPKPVKKRRRK